MSIKSWWSGLDRQKRFILSYPFWFLLLFGLFYWGKYWEHSVIAQIIDKFHRDIIMQILSLVVTEPIKGYDILFSHNVKLMITPECNGLVPYLMIGSAILAYPSKISVKIKWLIISYIVFMLANIIRLIVVYFVISIFGVDYFYLAHDIGGNIFLVVIGAFLFFRYLDDVFQVTDKK